MPIVPVGNLKQQMNQRFSKSNDAILRDNTFNKLAVTGTEELDNLDKNIRSNVSNIISPLKDKILSKILIV